MSQFRFKLAKVLEVKSLLEAAQRNELALRLADQHREETVLQALTTTLAGLQTMRGKEVIASVRAERLVLYRNYWRSLQQRIEVQTETLILSRQAADTCRERLLAVRRERKVLQNLADRQLVLYRQNENRLEQKLLDEVAGIKLARLKVDSRREGGLDVS